MHIHILDFNRNLTRACVYMYICVCIWDSNQRERYRRFKIMVTVQSPSDWISDPQRKTPNFYETESIYIYFYCNLYFKLNHPLKSGPAPQHSHYHCFLLGWTLVSWTHFFLFTHTPMWVCVWFCEIFSFFISFPTHF